MRWLLRYPITAEEVISTLEKIPDSQACGDLTGFIKRNLLNFVNDPENMQKLLETMKVQQ